MPIIPNIGRRHIKIRLAIAVVYAVLIMGGITMVYPFMLTLTQSLSNGYDYERYSPFPKYIFSEKERYLKYLAERYDHGRAFSCFQAAYKTPAHWGAFRDIACEKNVVDKYFPVFGSEKKRKEQLQIIYDDYCEFLKTYDPDNTTPLFSFMNSRYYQDFIKKRYSEIYLMRSGKMKNEISKKELESKALLMMAELCGTSYTSFDRITAVRELWAAFDLQIWFPHYDRIHQDYLDFIKTLPVCHRMPITRSYLWTRYLMNKIEEINNLNKNTTEAYKTIYDIPFDLSENAPAELKNLKEKFLQEMWPVRLVRIIEDREPDFRGFIRKQLPSLDAFNELAGTSYKSFDEIPFHRTIPSQENKAELSLWRDFVLSLPRDQWEILCPETAWQKFLLQKYKTPEIVKKTHGINFKSISDIHLPIPESDYYYYLLNKKTFFRDYLVRNYRTAIEFLLLKGRAFWNTVILLFLSILATFTVDPLAAYALSRFRPKHSYQILIFFLTTMAFPPMVAAIPGFLLLRDLGLLNTYAALILPSLANGFSIFLLKGFFDSLPNELYEAASMDGASEVKMFLVITLPLSKPILAVTVLNTFLGVYGGFMWALIVCQKEKMWTIMVWMLQFNTQFASMPYVAVAGLVMVSIPTLIVFLFCQKIILRGIIIPQMK